MDLYKTDDWVILYEVNGTIAKAEANTNPEEIEQLRPLTAYTVKPREYDS